MQQQAKEPFFVRMASDADVAECHAIDVDAWGEDYAAPEEMLRSRIKCYPCGNFVAVERATGTIVGSIWTIALRDKPISTWADTSGDGMYGEACDPHGPVLYGVNLSMRPSYAGKRIGHLLGERAVNMVWVLGKRIAMVGSRLPEFNQWQKIFAPEDYIRLEKTSGGLLYFRDPDSGACHAGPYTTEAHSVGVMIDPRSWPTVPEIPNHAEALDAQLAYYLDMRPSGVKATVIRLLPGYFTDPESCDNAVLIGWKNESYIAPNP